MNTTIQTEHLLRVLESLHPLFSKPSTLPSMGMVKLSSGDEGIRISANNLDLFCSITHRLDDPADFDIAVSGNRLLAAIKSAGGENVELSVKDNSLHFTCGNTKGRFTGMDLAELPATPQFKSDSICNVKGSELSQALKETMPFAFRGEGRDQLKGVFFSGSEKSLFLAATEGHSFSARKIDVPTKGVNAIIPIEACRVLAEVCGEVELSFSDNSFCADTGETLLIGTLLAGQYLEWRNYIPQKKDNPISVKIDRRALLGALSAYLSFQVMGRAYVALAVNGDSITLTGQDDTANSETTLPATVKGEPLTVGLDVGKFQTMLQSYDTPEIELLFKDEISPLLIQTSHAQNAMLPRRIKQP